ncbi:MAG TPA: hypothetical protein VK919_10085 [Solirubrobacterales bacterium]|nr:hypothetical protein [Solirubrobacterales bacterium]
MAEEPAHLSPDEDAALERLRTRIARNAEAVEQALELLENLADSGMLAAANGVVEEFDENFSALTRPDVMTMVANLMMLLGFLGQLPYEGGFKLALDGGPAIEEAYPRFRERSEPMKLREAIAILRSPDVAAAIELVVRVLRSQR